MIGFSDRMGVDFFRVWARVLMDLGEKARSLRSLAFNKIQPFKLVNCVWAEALIDWQKLATFMSFSVYFSMNWPSALAIECKGWRRQVDKQLWVKYVLFWYSHPLSSIFSLINSSIKKMWLECCLHPWPSMALACWLILLHKSHKIIGSMLLLVHILDPISLSPLSTHIIYSAACKLTMKTLYLI